jgi:RNA polymerase sigma factor (sigma-70 family)
MTGRERSRLTLPVVRQSLAGDRAAIREIVVGLTPVLHAIAGQALRRRGLRDLLVEIEDITQTVLAGLFEDGGKKLRQWDPSRSALETFVALLAEHEVADILRTRKRNPLNEVPTLNDALEEREDLHKSGPESDAAAAELFHKALFRLRADQDERGRELLELFLEGCPVEEICARTKMTTAAIYQRRSRLLDDARRVHAELASETGQPPRTKPEETASREFTP